MVKTIELTASDFPAAVDTTPIVRTRYPPRRYSFDGEGNLVVRQYRPKRSEPIAAPTADVAQDQGAPEATVGSTIATISAREFLTEAIATALRTTSLAPAAVGPMAQTLAALSGDLTIFDKTAEAQLQTIDMPSNAARSLLLEAIRNLVRFSNVSTATSTVIETGGNEPALRISPVSSRPFSSSSGSGYTTWQTIVQEEPISHPPASLKCSTGHLFIHRNPVTRAQTCWMYGRNGVWELVREGAEHPFIPDRVLHFRPRHNEEPSWNTRATMMTTRSRNERRETPGPPAG